MGAKSPAAAAMYVELEAEMLKEAERLGADGFDRESVIRWFVERGLARSTAYRWTAEIVRSGRLGQHVARQVRAAAAERAARSENPSADAARAVAAKLPVRASISDLTGTPAVKVMEKLASAIEDIDRVRAYAKTPDGQNVRNSKLLLQSVEALRRCLDTGARIAESLHQVDQVKYFHSLILEEIARESPQVAERILARVGQIAESWAPSA
jgi:hypothetical protein